MTDSGGASRRRDVRFFTMGDARYFLGAVALVNSLRIVGHDDPVTFLDLGLTPEQREIMATECDVVDIDRSPDRHPYTFQPYPHVLDPSGICVIVDSDVIVTSRLDAIIDAAGEGKIASYPDRIDRCLPEWEAIFGLHARIRPGIPYVNSGLVAFDAVRHRRFLARWWELCQQLCVSAPASDASPTGFADQDALNALLMSEYADDQAAGDANQVVLGSPALAATRIDDVESLECTRDGLPVVALHSLSQPKPWMPEARTMLRRNAFVPCLRRCLSGPGLTIELPEAMIPTWLRRGPSAGIEMHLLQRTYQFRRAVYNVRLHLPNPPETVPAASTTPCEVGSA
jgi:hypothetical protein